MKRKFLFAGAAALVLAALALAAAYFYIPGERPTFDGEEIRVCLNEDGAVELSWPEAGRGLPGASGLGVYYELDIKSGDDHVRLQSYPTTYLEKFSLPMTVRVQAAVLGKNLLGMYRTLRGQTLAAEVAAADLPAPEAVGKPGPGALSLSWKQQGPAPEFYEIFALEDGQGSHAVTANGTSTVLRVSKRDGDLPLPSYQHPLEVCVRAAVQGDGYILCGSASNTISVVRQDLLGDDLNLLYRETEPRVFTLEWDETRGEYYELQEWSEEGWSLLDTLEPQESFTYELGRLGSGSHHRFQVVAKDRGGAIRSSEETEFFASIDPLYATVWPIIDQPFYEKADKESPSLGTLSAGTALCVLEESGDWFQVRCKDQYGWVDSRFCLINLPEYVGDHCSYDITNSYRSIFKVHENPIALITGQVVKGFEHIRTADEQFLVPYLYPCSKKLLSAALAAEEDGYRLKIYEAFRPNEATRFLYDTTASQLDWAALVYSPEDSLSGNPRILDPVTGWEVDLADGRLLDPETGEKLSREELAQRQAEEAGLSPDGEPPIPDPDDQFMMPAEPQNGGAPETPDSPFFTLPEEGEGESQEPAAEAAPQAEAAAESEAASQPEPQTESKPEPGETPPETTPGIQPAEAPGETQEETPEEEEPEYDTYFSIMTNNGRFHLGSFLARAVSAHNRGIALDLTLEKIDGGEELEMQSAIHDLSWYSAAYLNNDNAKLLETYMTATGMRGLSSEWWHFQDDETREAINLTSYLSRGVSMEGWTRDDRGWRYRDEDGSILRNTTFSADGKRCTADRDGYVQE